MRAVLVSLLLLLATPAFAGQAQETPAEQQIRAVIAQWYAELAKEDEGRVRDIVAPGFIDATPHYSYIDNGSAALGPRVYTSLPAEALQFAYDIDAMRIDPNFAKSMSGSVATSMLSPPSRPMSAPSTRSSSSSAGRTTEAG